MSSHVVLELGRLTTLRLDDPPFNLMSRAMATDLRGALAEIESAEGVRAVIVTGSGSRAFCAGSDVSEFQELHGRVAEDKQLLQKLVYRQLARLPVPTIAAIEGDALGGGLELALCCDLRVASETARLGLPEVRLGTMPGSGGTQRLPRLIGLGRAKEMILTGEPIDAAEAVAIGLVNRAVGAGTAETSARELAETIASRGPLAVREAKAALDRALDVPLDEGLAAELEGTERLFRSEDLLEGVQAFLERRPSGFEGR